MMAPVRRVGWILLRCGRGMAHNPLVQLLAVATMSVCLLLLATITLTCLNAARATAAWGLDVPITAILRDDASSARVDEVVAHLSRIEGVASVRYVDRDAALERLQDGLGSDADLLSEIDASLLPASLELQLDPGLDPRVAETLAAQLIELDIVEEVAEMGAWAGRVQQAIDALGLLALGLGALVSVACVAIVWAMIRLGVHARRTEIEILRLVGGTVAYVRAPFVIEGALQGALGAGVAAGMLWLAYHSLAPWLADALALLFSSASLRFFSPIEVAAFVALGGLLGVLGARSAVDRYVGV